MLYPSYLNLLKSGELRDRAQATQDILKNCTLCPWQCGVDRTEGELGQCQIGKMARVYSFMLHHGEERPISGKNGSGTIFFSGCNMHCQFCQNADISQDRYGLEVSAKKLAEMMLNLQEQNCHNINLVTPSNVVAQFISALVIAAENGLHLPIVYNTGGYDSMQTLNLLDGIVDIYMPDMKYADVKIAERYSLIPDYPFHNRQAVKIMYKQVGDLFLNSDGIAISGLLVRHLVLPNDLSGTNEVMCFLSQEISRETYVNIMDQYRPYYHARQISVLNRRPTVAEFQKAVDDAINCGIRRIDHLFFHPLTN
jgi:putative pyruvate formate lyase activating enzyme